MTSGPKAIFSKDLVEEVNKTLTINMEHLVHDL